MIKTMAKDPIIFAMANPVPEITPEEAKAARPDVIMATGRSDYPNQVNNVLGFPFIFRGALDCRATQINEEMKLAASKALADLAKEDVPDSVARAYGVDGFKFGREYLIPKPFDWRVLLYVAAGGRRGGRGDRRRAAADRGPRRVPAGSSRGCSRARAPSCRSSTRRRSRARSGSSSPRATTRRSCAPRRSSPRRESPSRSSSRAGKKAEAALKALDVEGADHGRRPGGAPALRGVRRGLLREAEAPRRDDGGRRST